jgi:hypothetical protein
MLDGSSLFTIEGFEIGGRHRWQTGLRKGQAESTIFLVLFQHSIQPCADAQSSSLHNRKHRARLPDIWWIMTGVGGVASGSGPGAFLSEILKKVRSQANRGRRRRNFEECLRRRRAGPSHAVRSVSEHSKPQGRRRRRPVPWPRPRRTMALLRRARLRNRKRCPGPMCAAIGKLAFRVGRRVRISFAPAGSLSQR